MTTTVDFNALQTAKGPTVTLLANQDVGAGLVSSDFEDFSAFTSLCVDVNVQRKTVRTVGPSLTVLVEHSDDGLSWSTAETFSFTDDGEQTALISSPKAHVRASASGSAAEWYVRSVNVAPIFGGGGSSLPAGVPILYGPVDLNVDEAPQTQTLWTLNAGDIILDMWLEITAVMDASAAYEVYTDAIDFMFPQTGLNTANGDSTRWTPQKHRGVVASVSSNNTPGDGNVSVPSRMRTTTAVTCDKTSGAAGGAGAAYALVIPAA